MRGKADARTYQESFNKYRRMSTEKLEKEWKKKFQPFQKRVLDQTAADANGDAATWLKMQIQDKEKLAAKIPVKVPEGTPSFPEVRNRLFEIADDAWEAFHPDVYAEARALSDAYNAKAAKSFGKDIILYRGIGGESGKKLARQFSDQVLIGGAKQFVYKPETFSIWTDDLEKARSFGSRSNGVTIRRVVKRTDQLFPNSGSDLYLVLERNARVSLNTLEAVEVAATGASFLPITKPGG